MTNCENQTDVTSCKLTAEAFQRLHTEGWLDKTQVFELIAGRQLCANCPIAQWRQTLINNYTITPEDFGNDF